ncbi:hypothetical protein ACLKA7_014662 [Drosophila subpalustris]
MDGYNSDASSLTRDLIKLWQAGDLEVTSDLASEDEDADITVVESKSTDVCKDSADKLLPNEDNSAVSLELQLAPIRLLSGYMAYDQVGPLPDDIARSLVSDCAKNKIDVIIGYDARSGGAQTHMQGMQGIYPCFFTRYGGRFNNVFPEAITGALTGLGIKGRLVGLINQLLTSSAVTSTLGSSTLSSFCSCLDLSNRRLRTRGKPILDDLGGLSALSPCKIALFTQLSNWTPSKPIYEVSNVGRKDLFRSAGSQRA